jgi:WD40 repeat protein
MRSDVRGARGLCQFRLFQSRRSVCALGSLDTTLKLWDVETGSCVRTFEGHGLWVWSVCFSPDGRYVLSGSDDKTLKLWDVENR